MRVKIKKATKFSCVLTAALMGGTYFAQAGGFERSSQDFDILFEAGNQIESAATFVLPQRKLKNIRPIAPELHSAPVTKDSVNEGKSYWVPKISARFQLADNVACAAQYRQPWASRWMSVEILCAAIVRLSKKYHRMILGLIAHTRWRLARAALSACLGA